jgi:Fe-S cluster assembly iron-binding protein IscA
MKASGSFLEVIMITLTDVAAKKVAELLAEEGAQDLALRVSV